MHTLREHFSNHIAHGCNLNLVSLKQNSCKEEEASLSYTASFYLNLEESVQCISIFTFMVFEIFLLILIRRVVLFGLIISAINIISVTKEAEV